MSFTLNELVHYEYNTGTEPFHRIYEIPMIKEHYNVLADILWHELDGFLLQLFSVQNSQNSSFNWHLSYSSSFKSMIQPRVTFLPGKEF